jgi:hypothetical protein
MKKENNFIVYGFLIIILGVMLSYPIKYVLISKGIIQFGQTDNWQYYDAKGKNLAGKIKDKIMSVETNIDNRTTNYFPFYLNITSFFYNTNIKIDSLFSDDVFVKTNSDSEYLFYNTKDKFYHLYNHLSNDEMDKRLNNQINFYNDIKTKYENVNEYIYMPKRYEVNNIDKKRNVNEYVDKFVNGLNKDILFGSLDSENTSEYLKYFYHTDHHYNSYGALKAYQDIIKMMNIKDSNDYKVKDVKKPYYGSMAKSSQSNAVSDTLMDIDVKNGLSVSNVDSKFKPRVIPSNKNKFYDYYVGYYNGQYDEVIYKTNNNSKRNLLIISDSLAWQIDYLLANHYDTTYVVNMRYGKWLKNNLELDKYINEYGVTDVLFLQEAESEMFDVYNHNISARVVR